MMCVAKYETIAAKLQKEEEDKSQAYYIIKAAQEREELQKEGDELNLTIRQTEKEIRGLTRIMNTLNQRNSDVRDSFAKADQNGPLAKLSTDLTTQTRTVADTVNKRKIALKEVQIDYAHRQNTLGQLIQSIGTISKELDERQKDLLTIRAASKEQEAAIKRSETQMLAKRDEYRKKTGLLTDKDHSAEELAMALEEQRKKNAVFLDLIRQFATKNQIESYANDMLSAVGLDLAAAGSGSGGSRPQSATNSARSDTKTQPTTAGSGGAAGTAVPIRAVAFNDFKNAAPAPPAPTGALVRPPSHGKGRPPVVARPLSRGDNRPPSAGGSTKLPPVTGTSFASAVPPRGTTPPNRGSPSPVKPPSRPGSAKKPAVPVFSI